MTNKSSSAFKTIAEAAEDLGVATHVLRFWETQFSQIKPMKTKGARRFYRPDDMALLHVIKDYLYNKRYTIEGVQKLFHGLKLKDIIGGVIQDDFFGADSIAIEQTTTSLESLAEINAPVSIDSSKKQILEQIKNQLQDIKDNLSDALN